MSSFWNEQRQALIDCEHAIHSGLATVVVGRRNGRVGWAIPGGGFTDCKEHAQEVAGEMHKIMTKPGAQGCRVTAL